MHAKLITGEGDSTVHQSLYQGSSGAAGRPRSCVEAPAVEVGGPQAHVSVADAKEDVVDVGSGASEGRRGDIGVAQVGEDENVVSVQQVVVDLPAGLL